MRLFKRKLPCEFCGRKVPIDELYYVKILNILDQTPDRLTIQSGLACINCQPIRHGSHFRMATINTINPTKALK
jgi:hypothetical protein